MFAELARVGVVTVRHVSRDHMTQIRNPMLVESERNPITGAKLGYKIVAKALTLIEVRIKCFILTCAFGTSKTRPPLDVTSISFQLRVKLPRMNNDRQ